MSKTPQIFDPDHLTRAQELALIKIGIATIIQRTFVNGAQVLFADAAPTRKPRRLSADSHQKMAAAAKRRWAAKKAAARKARKGATDGQR